MKKSKTAPPKKRGRPSEGKQAAYIRLAIEEALQVIKQPHRLRSYIRRDLAKNNKLKIKDSSLGARLRQARGTIRILSATNRRKLIRESLPNAHLTDERIMQIEQELLRTQGMEAIISEVSLKVAETTSSWIQNLRRDFKSSTP